MTDENIQTCLKGKDKTQIIAVLVNYLKSELG